MVRIVLLDEIFKNFVHCFCLLHEGTPEEGAEAVLAGEMGSRDPGARFPHSDRADEQVAEYVNNSSGHSLSVSFRFIFSTG